jgi:hypothetical protein
MNTTTTFIRQRGTIAPKGRTAYKMKYQYHGARQYLYGAEANEVIEEVQWHRNDREAYLSGCEDDTRHGSAVGWEFLGFERA